MGLCGSKRSDAVDYPSAEAARPEAARPEAARPEAACPEAACPDAAPIDAATIEMDLEVPAGRVVPVEPSNRSRSSSSPPVLMTAFEKLRTRMPPEGLLVHPYDEDGRAMVEVHVDLDDS